ncbi:hypothetical protein MTO96_020408 [Rhipicephalus appendiculatus]
MRMHRYKCTEIVVNVLSPHFVELLVADIGDSKYSLIIDEATDISTTKLLGVVVRYFSAAQKSIVTTFLALIELDDGTAVTIVRALKNLLTRMGLDKKRLLGIGVDNASVNTGVNNGIFETIKPGPEVDFVRQRCVAFTVKLSNELRQRLPSNFKILQGMARLSVGACLRVLKEPITELAEHFGVQPNEIDLVNTQWKKLTLVDWANTTDTIAFWSEAIAYRDAAGSNPFHELAQLAVDVLSLPHSNAEVERVF